MHARELKTAAAALNRDFNTLDLMVNYCDALYLSALRTQRNPVSYVGFYQLDSKGRISAIICRDNGSPLPVLAVSMTIPQDLMHEIPGFPPSLVDFSVLKIAGIVIDRWVSNGIAFTKAEAMVHTMMERDAVVGFARQITRR